MVYLSIVAEKQQKCLRKTTQYTLCGVYDIILSYIARFIAEIAALCAKTKWDINSNKFYYIPI
jgi:hypothetical protein